MDTINEIKRQELPEEQEIDLIELAQKLWKERKFLLKGCGIAVVVGLIVAGFVSGCGAEYPVSVGIVSGRGYR